LRQPHRSDVDAGGGLRLPGADHGLPPAGAPRRGDPGGRMSAAAPTASGKRARRVPALPRLSGNASKALAAVVIVFAILLPFFYDPLSGFLDATTTALAYVVMALGLNIVVGFAGLLDLGYVAFFAIGAYTMGWLGSGFYAQINHGKGVHVAVSTFAGHLPGIHINFLLVLIAAMI